MSRSERAGRQRDEWSKQVEDYMKRNRKLKEHRMFWKIKAVQHCWKLKVEVVGDDQIIRNQTHILIV